MITKIKNSIDRNEKVITIFSTLANAEYKCSYNEQALSW